MVIKPTRTLGYLCTHSTSRYPSTLTISQACSPHGSDPAVTASLVRGLGLDWSQGHIHVHSEECHPRGGCVSTATKVLWNQESIPTSQQGSGVEGAEITH